MTNDPKTETRKASERVAANIMRILAGIGLVAVLAFIAWVIVRGAGLMPNVGESVRAAVSAVQSIFRTAPDTSLVFDLEARTFETNKEMQLRWIYEGPDDPEFEFAYECDTTVRLNIQENGRWEPLQCGEPFKVRGTSLAVLPDSYDVRFAGLELKIATTEVEDTTLVTVLNSDIASTLSGGSAPETPAATTTLSVPVQTPDLPMTVETVPAAPSTPAASPAPAPVVTLPAAPRLPADLAVNIEETGVYVPVAGRNTFFPIDPIPSDKTAGVVFTVTNLGDLPSGAWIFVAYVPVESDDKYKYTSPVQESLAPGMQVEFTLGFDEVTNADNGTIRIELRPTDRSDRAGNNIDEVRVKFED